MKKLMVCFVATLAFGMLVDQASAQEKKRPEGAQKKRPGGGRPGQGGRDGQGGRPRFDFSRLNPLLVAIDKDKDGTISAAELKGASAALATLDKNKDGKLTRDEMRPDFSQFRRPGGEGGRPGGGGGRPGGGGSFAERILGYDKNKDGKVTKEELPEQMRRILDRGDTNKDGALDKKEIDALTARFSRGGRPGGEGGRPKRPSGDGARPKRPGGEGGARPKRPARPDAK